MSTDGYYRKILCHALSNSLHITVAVLRHHSIIKKPLRKKKNRDQCEKEETLKKKEKKIEMEEKEPTFRESQEHSQAKRFRTVALS